MNDQMVKTLERILESSRERAAYDELRNASTPYRPDCRECDGTGWKILTTGKATTKGGIEVTASESVPIATRCPRGCKPKMQRTKSAQPAEAPRSTFGGN